MIRRAGLEKAVHPALRESPAVALVGPRPCGKTTLARQIARGRAADSFDLEDHVALGRLATPRRALEQLRLRRHFVVYPGSRSYRPAPKLEGGSILDPATARG